MALHSQELLGCAPCTVPRTAELHVPCVKPAAALLQGQLALEPRVLRQEHRGRDCPGRWARPPAEEPRGCLAG